MKRYATPITVRRANRHDAAVLVSFNQAMARETEGKELPYEIIAPGVTRLMQHPEYGFYLVAEVQERTVGSLLVTYEWSDWRNGVLWWIQSVYVWPEWRRHGIYRELYKTVRQLAAAESKVCGFRLYVEKDNERAQQTYRALGMTETDYRLYETITGIKPDCCPR